MATKETAIRVLALATSVGTTLVEVAVVVPRKGKIRRARADVTAGAAPNQVQMQVREITGGASLGTILSYALATEPLDSEEDLLYVAEEISGDRIHGTLYLAVAVDDATANHSISMSLDIDVLQ